MKIGDVALKGDELVKIVKIIYKDTPIIKRVKVGLFKWKDEPTGEIKKELDEVWWSKIPNLNDMMFSSVWSAHYDWGRVIGNATRLKKQFKMLEDAQ